MGGYAKFCIESLFGWLKTVVQQVWTLMSNPKGNNSISWIGENWKTILLVICAAGAAADLLVYLFRWEPIKVWKSYFRRKKQHSRSAWYSGDDGEAYDEYGYPTDETAYYGSEDAGCAADPDSIPDTYMQAEEPYPEDYPAENRPAETYYYDEDPRSFTERNLEKVVGPRRRKFRVNELFRDTDEGSGYYEAPQPVIDQTEAYHAPVFPRNWKENGDSPS